MMVLFNLSVCEGGGNMCGVVVVVVGDIGAGWIWW